MLKQIDTQTTRRVMDLLNEIAREAERFKKAEIPKQIQGIGNKTKNYYFEYKYLNDCKESFCDYVRAIANKAFDLAFKKSQSDWGIKVGDPEYISEDDYIRMMQEEEKEEIKNRLEEARKK